MEVGIVSFKGVYKDANDKFTPMQYIVCNGITNKLTSRKYGDKNRHTPDKILEKRGFNTIIRPSNNSDAVDVFVSSDINPLSERKTWAKENGIYVGTYNTAENFSPVDIDKAIENENKPSYFLILPMVIFLGGLAFLSIINNYGSQNKHYIGSPSTGVVDSLKNVYSDTLKLIQKGK